MVRGVDLPTDTLSLAGNLFSENFGVLAIERPYFVKRGNDGDTFAQAAAIDTSGCTIYSFFRGSSPTARESLVESLEKLGYTSETKETPTGLLFKSVKLWGAA